MECLVATCGPNDHHAIDTSIHPTGLDDIEWLRVLHPGIGALGSELKPHPPPKQHKMGSSMERMTISLPKPRRRSMAGPWRSIRATIGSRERVGHSGFSLSLDLILDPRPVVAMPLPIRPDGVHRRCRYLPLWLREVFPGVLAWLAWMIGCRRAGAGPRSGHIVGIALIVPDQHQICGEPVERGHFRRNLAVVLVGD